MQSVLLGDGKRRKDTQKVACPTQNSVLPLGVVLFVLLLGCVAWWSSSYSPSLADGLLPAPVVALAPVTAQLNGLRLMKTSSGKSFEDLVPRVTAAGAKPLVIDRSSTAGARSDPQPAIAEIVGRRQMISGPVLIGFLAATAKPMSALAEDDLTEGPGGLKFRELLVGTGATASEKDEIKATYVLKLAANGNTVFSGKDFAFTAGAKDILEGFGSGFSLATVGAGDMPPMKEGGVRQVILPPALAYGSQWGGCQPGGGCAAPPGSTLELIIKLDTANKPF